MHALLLMADGRFPAGGHAHSGGVESAVADGRVVDVASLAAYTEGRLCTVGLVEAGFAMATAWRVASLCPSATGASHPFVAATAAAAVAVRATTAAPPPRPEASSAPSDVATTATDVAPLDAIACRRLLVRLDTEMDARIPAPPLRAASRRLGRQLLRVASRCWPSPLLALAMEAKDDVHQSVAFGLVGAASALSVGEVGHLVAHHAITTPMQAGVRLLGLDPFAVATASSGLADVAAAVIAEASTFAAGPLEALPARSATLVDLAAMEHVSADGRLFAT